MKRIILLMAFMIAGMATAQITNIDKLRLNDIEEKIANDMVLTVDATGLVAWKNQTDITPDMSAYYTKLEIDAFFDNLTYADILDAPTALSQLTNDTNFITIGDVPVYTEGAGLDLVGGEFRIKQTVLNEITANTNKTLTQVTAQGNTTDIKIKGSSVFTNTADEDYAQIKNVNDAGHSLVPLQSEMKIALMAKDGTTVLSEADLSWLATGDLAITIDDTDPENPELVFTQGGLEVARIPASTLLTGVARSADLSGYKIQFKDGANTVVYSVDLQSLFDLKQDKLTATGDVVISEMDLIDLKQEVKDDIATGVAASQMGLQEVTDNGAITNKNLSIGKQLTIYKMAKYLTTKGTIGVNGVIINTGIQHTGITHRALLSFNLMPFINNQGANFNLNLTVGGSGALSSSYFVTDKDIVREAKYFLNSEGVVCIFLDLNASQYAILSLSKIETTVDLSERDTEIENGAIPEDATNIRDIDANVLVTKTYVDNAITAIPDPDLSEYYNKTESDSRFLRLETDQTVEGAITFTQNITVPTPVSPGDAVNKKYVDDLITDFIIIKNPDNTNDWLELNDFARGWVTPNVYVEGTWKGTDNPSQANIKIPANWSKTIILN